MFFIAADHCPEIMKHKPTGLEGIDHELVSFMTKHHLHTQDLKLLPEGRGWLLVEFGGETKEESDRKARELMVALKKDKHTPSMHLYDNPERNISSGSSAKRVGRDGLCAGLKDTWPGWEDSAVPPDRIGRLSARSEEAVRQVRL